MNNRLIEVAEHTFASVTQLLKSHPRYMTGSLVALMLGGAGATFAVASLGSDSAVPPVQVVTESVQPLPVAEAFDALGDQAMRLYRSDSSRSTDTAESLLKRLGVVDPQAAAFLRSDPIAQQNLLGRGGRNLTAEATASNSLLKLTARWSPDDNGHFKRLSIEKTSKGFQSRVESVPLSRSSRLASGIIHSSLFAATDEARIPDSIAMQVADIFSGDIDFHRALRKGDRFSVVYETLEGDGEPLRVGRVLNAEFVNAGKSFQAMWFHDPLSAASAGKGGYYSLAGESLRRAFLGSPMEFSRVTSGFKMRFHPILQTWRAHLGVDYAAPTGTPVRTVGDGVVELAGSQNGFGNVVIVQHGGNNKTVYAHLSRIHVKTGQRISQGQTVGAVGQTGWATGPHLHFEFRVNGAHRDPLAMARTSEAVPLATASRPAFEQAAVQVRTQLAAATQIAGTSTQ